MTDHRAGLTEATRHLSAKQMKSIIMSEQFTIALWVGAVSGGKTIASLFAFLFAILTAPKGETIVIIGQTLQTIERNVLTPLQNRRIFGPVANLVEHTTNSGTAVILGRTVELIGAYNARAENRIRGGTFGLVYVDEATLLPAEFWAMLTTRLRVAGARLLATTNPASRNHWLKKDYINSRADHDMVVFHFTMRDNPGLEPAYVARMARAWTGMFYKRFILGLWTTAEGAIYDAWNQSRHVIRWEDCPPIARVLAVGVDHGTTNPSSAMMLAITAETDERGRPTPRLVFLDEWRYDSTTKDPETGATPPRLTNVEQSKLLREWLNRTDHIPDDNPGWGLRPAFVFVDGAAADFREQLARDRVPNAAAEKSVAEGIADVSSLLASGRLLVTDRCHGFLSEVTEYVWDTKASEKGEDAPVKAHDHSLDAARYAVRSTRALWLAAFRAAYGLAA